MFSVLELMCKKCSIHSRVRVVLVVNSTYQCQATLNSLYKPIVFGDDILRLSKLAD